MKNAWCALFLILAACAPVGPDYRPPNLTLAGDWQQRGAVIADEAKALNWWQQFDDGDLIAAVETALAANRDLAQAEARLREARALRQGALADRGPSGGGRADAQRERSSAYTTRTESAPGANWHFEVGFDAEWEIDLFGQRRRTIEAADADLAAREAERRAVALSIAAETARTMLEIRHIAARRQIIEIEWADRVRLIEILTLRRQAGLATIADLALAETDRDMLHASQIALITEHDRALARLAVLTGTQHPPKLRPSTELPRLTQPLTLAAPVEILAGRPDLHAAERQVAAATAGIGVVTAELYPRISLGGSLGSAGTSMAQIFSSDGLFFGLGPRLRWPILELDRIRSRIAAQNARADQALASFQHKMLLAIEEIETALSAYNTARQRQHAVTAAQASAQSLLLAEETRFSAGRIDLRAVLEARQKLQTLRRDLLDAQASEIAAAIALFKASSPRLTATTTTPTG